MAIAGFTLVAVIVIAGLVFSPSGFVSAEPGATFGAGCVMLGTNSDLCDTAEAWQETFSNLESCNDALDENGNNCRHLDLCTCKALDE